MKKYLDDLASKKPAPGGGSVAALSAALGLALASMTGSFTAGNPKYKNVEKKAADMLAATELMRQEAERLIDRDVEAYSRLSAAMAAAGKDAGKLDAAFRDAAGVPLDVARLSVKALKLLPELARIGNKNLITDTAIAAVMLEGAFVAAKYNVYINLKYMKDTACIGKIHTEMTGLEKEAAELKEETLEQCEEIIQK